MTTGQEESGCFLVWTHHTFFNLQNIQKIKFLIHFDTIEILLQILLVFGSYVSVSLHVVWLVCLSTHDSCTLHETQGIMCSKYCKRGYFRWGKISRKCWQDISHGGNFHDTTCTPISFIKVYGFYFHVGVICAKKAKSRKTRKFPR